MRKGPFRNPKGALFWDIFGGFSMFFEAFGNTQITYRADIQRFMQSAEILAYFGRATVSVGNIAKMGQDFNSYPLR